MASRVAPVASEMRASAVSAASAARSTIAGVAKEAWSGEKRKWAGKILRERRKNLQENFGKLANKTLRTPQKIRELLVGKPPLEQIQSFVRWSEDLLNDDYELVVNLNVSGGAGYDKEVGDFLVEKGFLVPIDTIDKAKKLVEMQANIVVKGGLLHCGGFGAYHYKNKYVPSKLMGPADAILFWNKEPYTSIKYMGKDFNIDGYRGFITTVSSNSNNSNWTSSYKYVLNEGGHEYDEKLSKMCKKQNDNDEKRDEKEDGPFCMGFPENGGALCVGSEDEYELFGQVFAYASDIFKMEELNTKEKLKNFNYQDFVEEIANEERDKLTALAETYKQESAARASTTGETEGGRRRRKSRKRRRKSRKRKKTLLKKKRSKRRKSRKRKKRRRTRRRR